MQADEARSLLASLGIWFKNQDHSLMEPVINRIAEDLQPERNDFNALSHEMMIVCLLSFERAR